MPVNLAQARKELNKLKDFKKAEFLKRFFKTGPGEYSEGDNFLGITVPANRAVAQKFFTLPLKEVFELLKGKYHEERLMALFILVEKFEKSKSDSEKKLIVTKYLQLVPKYVNNWDLVDSSASYIVGNYLLSRPRAILYTLARSKNLWNKRVAIVSTQYFIRQNDFKDTIKISDILMRDKHDLIHKATGWMLREMGKRSEKTLTQYLNKNAHKMPRTMLRYSIEKYSPAIRQKYLKQTK